MKKKITGEQINNSVTLIAIAMDNYSKDDDVFNFVCSVCESVVYASLLMFDDSLHGVIKCKNYDTYIHV